MNRLLKMLIWLSIAISTSCAISKKENERIDQLLSQQSKEIEIPKADSITTEMLRKFEVHATQKLEDIYDYLELLGNKSYSEGMKDEIKISALELFYHANSSVLLFDETSEEPRSVEEALNVYEEETSNAPLSVSKIEIVKPLSQAGKDLFMGQMSFDLTIGKEDEAKVMRKNVDFSLRKVEKGLGKESIIIWEIFLEGIR